MGGTLESCTSYCSSLGFKYAAAQYGYATQDSLLCDVKSLAFNKLSYLKKVVNAIVEANLARMIWPTSTAITSVISHVRTMRERFVVEAMPTLCIKRVNHVIC